MSEAIFPKPIRSSSFEKSISFPKQLFTLFNKMKGVKKNIMKIFYGGAIQGALDRSTRTHIHDALIAKLKAIGHSVFSEHLKGNSVEETAQLLSDSLGELPPVGIERTRYIRRAMIKAVESDIDVAIFEVSVPSLGTGIELAHAYFEEHYRFILILL